MSTAVAVRSSNETKWTVISGSMRGSVRLMGSDQFIIGRSPECEFVLVNDPKCSRRHASVQWTAQGVEVTSLNDKNLVHVNDVEVQSAHIKDGDILTLGETKVQFNHTSKPEASTAMRVISQAPVTTSTAMPAAATPSYIANTQRMPSPQAYAPQPQMQPPPRRRRSVKKSNPMRMVIYFVIGLTVLWLFTGNSAKKKAEQALRTEKQIQADIETANKLTEAAQNLPGKGIDASITTRQAQENFVRGFRDYRKGQFERSLDSFQTCLALNPSHALCNRYMRLAQRRFNELVQYNMVLGRKYRDQNQFQACRAAFRNVMVMNKDANSSTYREAKANYDACNSFVEGRY